MFTLRYRKLLVLFSGAVIGTLIVFGLAIYAQANYQQHNAYFFDAVYYQSYNASLAQRLQTESRFTVALDEWLHNNRHPLRTTPLVLFTPALLTNPYGHLVSVGLTFTLLLTLVGYLVFTRRQSIFLALTTQLFFIGLPILYDVNRGIANYWLEWGATLWLGCALCCILLAADFPKQQRWIIGFAVSAAAAVLSRYIAGVFVAVVCIVPFVFFLWQRWIIQKRWRDVGISLLIPGGIIFGLAGYFLVAHFSSNVAFYNNYGYAINQTFASSWSFICTSLLAMWQLQGDRFPKLFIYTGIIIVIISIILTLRRQTIKHWLIAIWISVATPLTLLALGTVGAFHPLLYGLFPLLAAGLFSAPQQTFHKWQKIMQSVLIGLVIFTIMVSINQQRLRISTLAQQIITPEKFMNQQIADGLNQAANEPIVWQAFFDEYSTIPTMELYFSTGKLALPAGQPYFNQHLTAWKVDYPGLTKEQVAERVYSATNKWVDVAVVFADPAKGIQSSWIDNEYSSYMVDYMSRTIQTDPHWQKIFTIQSGYSPDLYGYRNMQPTNNSYKLILDDNQLVKP
ncbi:MAG: hypothetical protein ACD_43C00110G0002 [uncultured bacterium]|nr:MAG: hypothetical protein ACD_43C00110G0002 [uncultured bacterium]